MLSHYIAGKHPFRCEWHFKKIVRKHIHICVYRSRSLTFFLRLEYWIQLSWIQEVCSGSWILNLKSREVGLKIFFLSLELKKYTRFLEMCHFSKWNIAKSDATLLHVSKNTTLLQKSAASTRTSEGNTCSKYYCICQLERNSTIF